MTKDIIKLTATLLGLEDVTRFLDGKADQTEEIAEKIDTLIVYTNYILREITKEYYPLVHEEKVTTDENCQIFFSKLEKKAIAIKDVKTCSGMSVTFNLYPEFIKLSKPLTSFMVEYNYVPDAIHSIEEEICLPLGLDPYVVCYGVASEYALANLLYDESEMWQSKFKTALEGVKSRVGERRFFARRLK